MNPKKKPLLTTVFIGVNAEYKSNTPLPNSNTGTYAHTHICTIMIATPSYKAMGSVCVYLLYIRQHDSRVRITVRHIALFI